MPSDSICYIILKYTSDQNPQEETTGSIYNSQNNKKQRWIDEDINELSWQIYTNQEKDKYLDAYEKATFALKFSYSQKYHILYTCANLAFALGKKSEAIQYQKEALTILRRSFSEKEETIEEYERKLKEFSE